MYHVYILRSTKSGRLFKGQTQNVPRAVELHNQGHYPATQHGVPWELIHEERYASRIQANKRERYLKTIDGSHEIKQQLGLEDAEGHAIEQT